MYLQCLGTLQLNANGNQEGHFWVFCAGSGIQMPKNRSKHQHSHKHFLGTNKTCTVDLSCHISSIKAWEPQHFLLVVDAFACIMCATVLSAMWEGPGSLLPLRKGPTSLSQSGLQSFAKNLLVGSKLAYSFFYFFSGHLLRKLPELHIFLTVQLIQIP